MFTPTKIQWLIAIILVPSPSLADTVTSDAYTHAFECAALAAPWNIEEHGRLFKLGYEQGQEYMMAAMADIDNATGIEQSVKGIWQNYREAAAFELGKIYAHAENSAVRMKARESEFYRRNCHLIGR